jgi:transcription elongation factor GreA
MTETWLSQEAYDRLQAEYEHLSGPARVEISKRIEAAREEGDLRENGGYHAAKEEQGKMEARIRQLRQLLESAQVGEAPSADGNVKVGMIVAVTFVGGAADGEQERFLLGSREQAGDVDLDVYSPQSPLGAAVLGQSVGTQVAYSLPNGKSLSVRIDDAQPFGG